jgi:hypothetical protein
MNLAELESRFSAMKIKKKALLIGSEAAVIPEGFEIKVIMLEILTSV